MLADASQVQAIQAVHPVVAIEYHRLGFDVAGGIYLILFLKYQSEDDPYYHIIRYLLTYHLSTREVLSAHFLKELATLIELGFDVDVDPSRYLLLLVKHRNEINVLIAVVEELVKKN